MTSAASLAATLYAALERAEDPGTVICLVGRVLDQIAEDCFLTDEQIKSAEYLQLRERDFARQAEFYRRQKERFS